MATEFKRETRYFVIKVKEFAALERSDRDEFIRILDKLEVLRRQAKKRPLKCVVVEDDWPEYEVVWQMIEARLDPDRAALTPAEAAQHWRDRYLEAKKFGDEMFAAARSLPPQGETEERRA